MADPLTEAENLCQQTLQALETQTRGASETIEPLRKSLQSLLSVIAESKRKVMVRSAQGQKLAQEIRDNASKLYDVTKLPRPEGKGVDELGSRLASVEGSVTKLKIYWQSFEYATT
ncbi:hypothetical protein AC480_02720 [miscellaneous Crenarchaeota group archaeon SMTZ1-55]|nr:MAG: hypothetical protein AC480_02720 [miscellaneous Crenarchaeota group archaeon SMTZ1-55]